MKLDYPTYQRTIGTGYGAYPGHTGCDFVVPIGTPIYAPADGTIIEATEITGYEGRRMINGKTGASVQDGYRSYGRKLVIQHAENTKTLYAHLSKFVKTSGKVKKGELVAYSGNAGNVRSSSGDGAHLHFEVIVNGIHENPIDYLGKNGPTNKGGAAFDDNAATSQQITYRKMKGNGKIIADYTDIYWYTDSSNKPKPWGFYGMKDEIMNLIGKVDNYYYGWINGICQSRILGLVPIKKVKLTTGKLLSGTSTFTIGADLDNSVSTGTITPGKKYSLTNAQIDDLAHICVREQGHDLDAIAAEASIMANIFEYKKWCKATSRTSLYDYVLNGGWFGSSTKSQNTIDNSDYQPTDKELAAVKDALVNGNRTLPLYINEHDWTADIAKLDSRVTGLSKSQSESYRASHAPSYLTDHSNYISGKTKIINIFGSKWTFYTFFSTSKYADPFGYTQDWYNYITKK